MRSNASVCETCPTDPTGGGMTQIPFFLEKSLIYIGHIRAHYDLHGPLAAGNDCIDKALIGEALVSDSIVLAKCGHNKIDFSSHNLMLLHKIPRKQARRILRQCPDCLKCLT